jgi:hypothetical protein
MNSSGDRTVMFADTMMRGMIVLAAALSVATVRLAPTELMLCLHRDGSFFVEPFQERCCGASCSEGDLCGTEGCGAPPECPDEECQDLPLTAWVEGTTDAPQGAGPAPAGIPVPVPAAPPVADPEPTRQLRTHPDFLGPPVSRSLLRTVLLRL